MGFGIFGCRQCWLVCCSREIFKRLMCNCDFRGFNNSFNLQIIGIIETKSLFKSVQIDILYHVLTTYKVHFTDLADISAFRLDTVKKTFYIIQFFYVRKPG